MRNPIVVAASLLFVVASAFAQQSSRRNAVSLFVSDLSLSDSSSRGFRSDAGYGVALDHMFSDRVSAELSVSRQTIRRNVATFSSTGLPGPNFREFALYPIDASVSYHFVSGSRWRPYLGAGLRYVGDSEHFAGLLGGYDVTSRAVAPEVFGGITFQFHPDLGVRLDAKQIAGGMKTYITEPVFKGSDALSFVPAFQLSLGLSLRF
jgi:outer membrane protein W